MSIDKLSIEIDGFFKKYTAEAMDVVDDAIKKTSANCVRNVREKAPKRTGAYAKSWSRKMSNAGRHTEATVYAKAPHYRLTHLLENGHATADGGRVEGKAHIKPAAEEASRELEQRITQGMEAIVK